MPAKTKMTVPEAVAYAKELGVDVSRPTVIKYAMRYKLGYQLGGPGGKWIIKREAFRRFISGQDKIQPEKVSGKANGKKSGEEEKIGGPAGSSTRSNSIDSA